MYWCVFWQIPKIAPKQSKKCALKMELFWCAWLSSRLAAGFATGPAWRKQFLTLAKPLTHSLQNCKKARAGLLCSHWFFKSSRHHAGHDAGQCASQLAGQPLHAPDSAERGTHRVCLDCYTDKAPICSACGRVKSTAKDDSSHQPGFALAIPGFLLVASPCRFPVLIVPFLWIHQQCPLPPSLSPRRRPCILPSGCPCAAAPRFAPMT